MLVARVNSIAHAVTQTCFQNREAIQEAVDLLAHWMQQHAVVRILGAGRALLSISLKFRRPAMVKVRNDSALSLLPSTYTGYNV